jgi:hypothetical protein
VPLIQIVDSGRRWCRAPVAPASRPGVRLAGGHVAARCAARRQGDPAAHRRAARSGRHQDGGRARASREATRRRGPEGADGAGLLAALPTAEPGGGCCSPRPTVPAPSSPTGCANAATTSRRWSRTAPRCVAPPRPSCALRSPPTRSRSRADPQCSRGSTRSGSGHLGSSWRSDRPRRVRRELGAQDHPRCCRSFCAGSRPRGRERTRPWVVSSNPVDPVTGRHDASTAASRLRSAGRSHQVVSAPVAGSPGRSRCYVRRRRRLGVAGARRWRRRRPPRSPAIRSSSHPSRSSTPASRRCRPTGGGSCTAPRSPVGGPCSAPTGRRTRPPSCRPCPRVFAPVTPIHPRLSADGCVVVAVTEIPFDLFRDDDRDLRWDVYRLLVPECGGQVNGWELVSTADSSGVARDDVFVDSAPSLSGPARRSPTSIRHRGLPTASRRSPWST